MYSQKFHKIQLICIANQMAGFYMWATLAFNGLKSYNRISLETFRIQILFFKNLYHLNSKSKENFLNIEVYGVFLLTFIMHVFKNKGDSLGWCS